MGVCDGSLDVWGGGGDPGKGPVIMMQLLQGHMLFTKQLICVIHCFLKHL